MSKCEWDELYTSYCLSELALRSSQIDPYFVQAESRRLWAASEHFRTNEDG